jgi:hypothetical protein
VGGGDYFDSEIVMGSVTPFFATRTGEYVIDREQAAADEAQHQREVRADLVHNRVNEILAKRMAELSLEDMALVFEDLSTPAFSGCLEAIRKALLQRDTQVLHSLLGMIEGLLVRSSTDQAREEFAKLDALARGDCH